MRIISGTGKGRQLKGVPGTGTRPTADKVKESVFNMIGPYFCGGVFLDVYAGSGGMGIEALSRGMEKAVFIDKERKAVSVIYDNLKSAGFVGQAEVFRTDSGRALKAIKKNGKKFDVIFLDPPYGEEKLNKELQFFDDNRILNKNGCIVAEHSSKVTLDSDFSTFSKHKLERYGDTAVTIYKSDVGG